MIAEKLTYLGFRPGIDFIARDDGDGPYLEEWLSDQPQPSAAEIEAATAPPPIVSMRQARLALVQAGLYDQVLAAVATLGTAEQIDWEYATEVRRDHSLIAAIGTGLQLSKAEVDGLFELAATL